MDDLHAIPRQGKISPNVLARLVRLSPNQRLRAIVLLNTPNPASGPSRKRPTRNQRQAVIDEMRDSASPALSEIDGILMRFDGRRLSQAPTALGTIAVESNPAGIAALSKSGYLKPTLEDQPVSRVS